MSKWTLLWENPNPSASFTAQNITLSSSDYDLLLMLFYQHGQGSQTVSVVTVKGLGFYLMRTGSDSRGAQGGGRICNYVSDTEYAIDNGYSSIGATYYGIENGICIPYKVYGIKL